MGVHTPPNLPLNRKLHGPQSQSGHFGEQKKSLAHSKNRPLDCPICGQLIITNLLPHTPDCAEYTLSDRLPD